MRRRRGHSHQLKVMALSLIGTAVCCAQVSLAEAATTHQSTFHMQKKAIVLNGKAAGAPFGFTSHNTTYMPIWYVMHALESIGIHSTWSHRIWNMEVPTSKFHVDLSKIKVGTGEISLTINGKLVHKVNGIVAVDPSSGKPTTFVPIWYTQELLKRAGITSKWNGTSWQLQVGGPDGHPVTPPPKLPKGEIATWQFLAAVDKSFDIAPDTSGKSPYTDIASTDPHWGFVQSAIKQHLITPTKTHSGAYDALRVSAMDQILWNAFGLKGSGFEPGQTAFAWANTVELNPPNVQSTDFVTSQEFAQMVSNLANVKRGFRKNSTDSYQIVYPPANESSATFASDSSSGQPFFTSTQSVQNAIVNTYHFYDNIQVRNQNGSWTLSMPSMSGTKWFSYVTANGSIQYQLPNFNGWQDTPVLDSREFSLTTSDRVEVKLSTGVPITISMNQMLPDFGGTVPLGELQVEVDAKGLHVQRLNLS